MASKGADKAIGVSSKPANASDDVVDRFFAFTMHKPCHISPERSELRCRQAKSFDSIKGGWPKAWSDDLLNAALRLHAFLHASL